MSSKWVSLNEACEILSISLSTLRRRIKKGEFESKLDGKRRLVFVSDERQISSNVTQSMLIEQMRDEVQNLRDQLAAKDVQIEQIQAEAREAKARSDTIILTLTEQLRQPFWRRWFGRQKALPRGEVVDMTEADSEEQT